MKISHGRATVSGERRDSSHWLIWNSTGKASQALRSASQDTCPARWKLASRWWERFHTC